MIHPTHLREEVIRPALEAINLWSPVAEDLVLATAAVESHGGVWLRQIRGPALGIFQMEPDTHDDIWRNWLRYRPSLSNPLRELSGMQNPDPAFMSSWESLIPSATRVVWNLRYAAAMCRIHYRRVPKALPEPGDIEGFAVYWKRHYNTHEGAGGEDDFLRAWRIMQTFAQEMPS